LVTLKQRYNPKKSFWDNARRLHQKLGPLLTAKRLFQDLRSYFYLDPSVLEAFNFKRLGGLVGPDAARHAKLTAFSEQDDVVSSILEREKMDSLDRTLMGTAITNLTRMDFPRQVGSLELDRLIMHPGGGFPLVTVDLVLGAVTCAGKLSLVLEYAQEAVDPGTMERIREQVADFLIAEP
jgi:hypothetical protein